MTGNANEEAAAGAPAAVADPVPDRRLGVAMWVIAFARFLVVLDGTIMIVALPSIQDALKISPSNLNWVINAYSLTFGGLMLVAGRVGDLYGRKKIFRVGLVLFGAASLLGGLAPTGGALIAFRAVQGVGAAIATPGALSLLVATFPEGRPRTRALGLYGGMTGLASVMGLVLGGVLTTYAGWRWVLLVNVPVIIGVLLGVNALDEGAPAGRTKIDLPGAAFATLGAGSLVYAVDRVGEHGWSDAAVVGCLTGSALLLSLFVAAQRIGRTPMVPREVVGDRGRGGANIVTLLMSTGSFATYFFLTLYMQQILGYSALRTGLMYLPLAVGFGIAAGGVGPQLLARTSERAALSLALALAAAGTAWFGFLTVHSSMYGMVMPASLVTGLGLGATVVVSTGIGVRGIDGSEAGIGSALLTAGSQIGGALGLAGLATVAVTATRHAAKGTPLPDALVHGYTAGFRVAVGLYLLGIVVALVTVTPYDGRRGSAAAPAEVTG
ncbi:MFS transporter [Actinomadura nitritigenes]|uniref:MFS transporter n=2 Tax=Actinomadura nitritigenes TaxID=134602 RepID=A0ABS3RAM5_9ACTN|nr:MFS transporter [Actinomadura nitritigenes]MBO2442897.1 MFS transporter [Actinomadura nitritigenes]